ncbi:uncharacterized protein Z520_02454 [Fonsecaea multimorphosa CBS 102226]|uniref:GH64 domain-containing protein n=1 Tax=Fonsecaea multimorphosa CBS 102226 TaxID=1442371 RepID=A0A0D2HKA3_9EURO|nr:uncharacterized protein Z520_02454 [Fonsecaea multimorphosa CBS 102226]KIY02316.1 hypothetical protein Z520_02454 [Fonsecaea multimorphosa CBS 102226]OAL28961.1 hypothetical protein AYO22_02397 [Fonsecaea multimorphosa]
MQRLHRFFRRVSSGGSSAGPQAQVAIAESAQASGPSLQIALQNQTTSSTVYAYITGQAIDRGNALFLLSADGQTPFYPTSPGAIGSPIPQNCAIALGAPGNTVTVTIPHVAGGRIWFSIDAPLTFLLNPGPALVEPSVTNPSDPNANTNWGFAEFTFNSDQLYANISYVDFVGPPIALTLTTQSGATQHVSGMPANGLDTVCNGLRAQQAADGKGWDQLIVTHNGQNLRALSPNQGMVTNPSLFANYFDAYVNQVWQKFTSQSMSIDTQASFGVASAKVSSNGALNFGGSSFTKPSTRDIFSCSTGPFATGSNAETNAIIPRLAAAFNRSTLLTANSFPAPQSSYYKDPTTNHYSRIVHSANLDGKGYAFPYDDVQPSGGADQSGEVHAGDPILFTVTVGGTNASVNPPPKKEL